MQIGREAGVHWRFKVKVRHLNDSGIIYKGAKVECDEVKLYLLTGCLKNEMQLIGKDRV